MASLVADYGTSSGEESDDSGETKPESSVKPAEQKVEVNFFSTAPADTDSDEDADEQETVKSTHKTPKLDRLPNPLAPAEKLPTPLLANSPSSGLENSVFFSSYHKAEVAKHSVLEQHVKMTSSEIQAKTKDGKRICWNFRKGKCRFGGKCKYSHGMDIPGTVTDDGGEGQPGQSLAETRFKRNPPLQDPEPDDDSYMAEAKRKKRVGVSNALIPPKKAMQSLNQQREHERPWTLPK